MFDPTRKQNDDDVALLAKRRLTQTQNRDAPASTVNFPGFADIFRLPNMPPLLPGVNPAPPPTMKLDEFCEQYELSDSIRKKLGNIQITGPHVLCLISDSDLRGEGQLSIGELASVRDAQLRWNHYFANPA
jgi:hypothetical protein